MAVCVEGARPASADLSAGVLHRFGTAAVIGKHRVDIALEPRFTSTKEIFVDPTSGHRMRVFLDPRTGERRYRAEG